MSLLVTSCTMGKQPDRLLHKGPEYLRTRTNHGIFSSEKRKSAVELLAASKAQFYTLKDTRTILDRGQDLAVTDGQHNRYGEKKRHRSKNLPLSSRSKSEHNLAQIQLSPQDEDNNLQHEISNDLNNNTSNKSKGTGATGELVEATQRLSLDTSSLTCTTARASTNNHSSSSATSVSKPFDLNRRQKGETVVAASPSTVANIVTEVLKEDLKTAPKPYPRKRKEKPVPPPRRRSPRINSNQTEKGKQPPASSSETISRPVQDQPNQNAALESKFSSAAEIRPKDHSCDSNHSPAVFKSTARLCLSGPAVTCRVVPVTKPKVPPRPRKLDVKAVTQGNEFSTTAETVESPCSSGETSKARDLSLVETLTKQFTSLSASKPERTDRCEAPSYDRSNLFKATPVIIKKCDYSPSNNVYVASPGDRKSVV